MKLNGDRCNVIGCTVMINLRRVTFTFAPRFAPPVVRLLGRGRAVQCEKQNYENFLKSLKEQLHTA